jgi:hypothetical protein
MQLECKMLALYSEKCFCNNKSNFFEREYISAIATRKICVSRREHILKKYKSDLSKYLDALKISHTIDKHTKCRKAAELPLPPSFSFG